MERMLQRKSTSVRLAMWHTSSETKRQYQLAMTHQVRERIEQMNEWVYGETQVLQYL